MTASENKAERHTAIRALVTEAQIQNQDALKRKLGKRGFDVTQATLSRDIRELGLNKGPGGYALPTNGAGPAEDDEDELPALGELLQSFGLRVKQAQNLLVLVTLMGSAQPVAAALDQEELPEVVGTVAGDNTVLLVCPNKRQAGALASRLKVMIG